MVFVEKKYYLERQRKMVYLWMVTFRYTKLQTVPDSMHIGQTERLEQNIAPSFGLHATKCR
jgi:hypothetical protein